MCIAIIRFDPDGLTECRSRFLEFALLDESFAEIYVSLHKILADPDRLTIRGNCLVRFVLIVKHDPQIIIRASMIRLNIEDAPITSFGLG